MLFLKQWFPPPPFHIDTQICQRLTEYGIHFHRVLPEKKSQTGILLGVCPKGVIIFEVQNGVRTPVIRFPWRETKKISFSVCWWYVLFFSPYCTFISWPRFHTQLPKQTDRHRPNCIMSRATNREEQITPGSAANTLLMQSRLLKQWAKLYNARGVGVGRKRAGVASWSHLW